MSCERISTLFVAAALAGAAALFGCADFSRGATTPDATDGGGGGAGGAGSADAMGATLSFASDVYPLLVPACQKCHSTGQAAGDTKLLFTGTPASDQAAVVMFVDTSSPSSSRILAKMRGSGHQGGTVYALGSPEYLTVLHWIEQGASAP
jgi:hypothetical protein